MKSRQMLLVAAVAVVVAAAGIFYFVGRPDSTPIPTSAVATAPSTASGALMTPGPLGDKALGDPKAPNVVIEYASMTCPHCQRFHETVFTPFKEKYIDTGKVYFIMREFPSDPVATAAFMLARCAPGDAYFPMLDLLFDHQTEWAFNPDPKTALLTLVKQAGFTQDSFNACLTNQQILDGVNAVRNSGAALGVERNADLLLQRREAVRRVDARSNRQDSWRLTPNQPTGPPWPASEDGGLSRGVVSGEVYATARSRLQVIRRAYRIPDRTGPHRRGRAERLRQIQPGRGAPLGDGRSRPTRTCAPRAWTMSFSQAAAIARRAIPPK